MKNQLRFLWALLFLFTGCGGSNNGFTAAPPAQVPQVATIRLSQPLLRAVPQEVTRQRFSGFDSSGLIRYGPETRDKANVIELQNVSTAVARLQIEYLQGETVIGLGSVALELTPGKTVEINNPPFQDVVSALSSLQVTPGGTTIADGSGQQFTVIGTFADNTQLDLSSSARWSSSNPSVATIAPGGLASAVSPGETTVTAAIGPVSDSTALTVSTATISSIQVTPNSPVIAAGTTQDFTATATLTNGQTQDVTTSAQWSSSNTSVATVVSNTGVASGVAAGQSQISASVGNTSGQTTLTVSNANVTSLIVSPGNPTLAKGTTQQFQVIANFSSGPPQDVTSSAVWLSSNNSIATISATGLATAVSPGGPITIAASFGGQSVDTNLTVTDASIQSIAVTPANPAIADGTNQQFVATATLTDGTTDDITLSATWTSGTTATATIAPGGLASAVNPGQTLITASSSSVSGSATLTVTAATVESIAVTPVNPTLANGASQQFRATATLSDSSTQDVTSSAAWVSGTTGVATITNPGGLATVVADTGTSQVSATFGGQTGSTTLTASDATVESITITPNPAVLAEGQTQQFTATANLSDGSTPNVTDIATWSSGDTNIATIVAMGANGGLASAAGIGNTQVTATFGGQTGSAAVIVTQATLQSLAINPPRALTAPGSKRRYRAIGTYTDGSTQDLTSQVTWSSSDTGVRIANDNLGPNIIGEARVDQNEPVTGPAGTPVTITATMGSLSSTSTLHIGAFAYVANTFGNNISIFTIDPSTGALTAGSPTAVGIGTGPNSVTVDPSGRFVYVANLFANNVSVFTINPTTGGLTAGTPALAGDEPASVAVDPSGRFAYVANRNSDNVSVFTINPTTGALTAGTPALVGVGDGPVSIKIDPSGRFAYVTNQTDDNVSVFTIDPTTGALTAGTPAVTGVGATPVSVTVDPSGRFAYVANRSDDNVSVFTINPTTGALTAGTPAVTGVGDTPVSMTVDPSGRFFYVANRNSDNVSVFTINPTTGALTAGIPAVTGVGDTPVSVTVDPSGRFVYVANSVSDDVSVFTINPTTGGLTAGISVGTGLIAASVVTTP